MFRVFQQGRFRIFQRVKRLSKSSGEKEDKNFLLDKRDKLEAMAERCGDFRIDGKQKIEILKLAIRDGNWFLSRCWTQFEWQEMWHKCEKTRPAQRAVDLSLTSTFSLQNYLNKLISGSRMMNSSPQLKGCYLNSTSPATSNSHRKWKIVQVNKVDIWDSESGAKFIGHVFCFILSELVVPDTGACNVRYWFSTLLITWQAFPFNSIKYGNHGLHSIHTAHSCTWIPSSEI